MKNAWAFLTKLARLSRHRFEKERRQSETLFCLLQTSIAKTSLVGRIETLFKDRYDMQGRKWFLLTRLFSLWIFQHTKIQKCCFSNKTDTALKPGCVHTETLLSEIGTGFYWLICFNCWKIRRSCFWSKIILLSRHSFEKQVCSVFKLASFDRNV